MAAEKLDPKLPFDPSNPYFISSHDGPGNVITPVIFRGDNYEELYRSMRLSLMAHRKFEFVEGTITKPTDNQGLRDWRCLHALLVQWILNTIDPSVKKTLPYFEEAKPLWDVLRLRFNVRNGARKQRLKTALTNCIQLKNMSIAEYFGKLQPLWDELATYNPIPNCKCGGCTCDIGTLLHTRLEEDRLHDFLFGINAALYGHIRSQILSHDPLPSLDRIYQMFLQEERLQMTSAEQTKYEDIRAMAVQSKPSSAGSRLDVDKSRLLCTYCERRGHDVDNCWSKHGYPKWWEHRNSRGGGRFSSRGGRGSRSSSHSRDNHTQVQRNKPVHTSSVAVVSRVQKEDNLVGSSTSDAILSITTQQWQRLLDLLGNSTSPITNERLSGPTFEDSDWSR
ncbi:unnamed protein product [Amaranthus hypochondriacus]